MLIQSVERHAETELAALLESANRDGAGGWGIVCVPRHSLRSLPNDSFLLAVKSALQEATRATIYFASQSIYVAWTGMRRQVEAHLRGSITGLLADGIASPDDVRYIDPVIEGNELLLRIKEEASSAPATKVATQQATTPAVIQPAVAPTARPATIANLETDPLQCRDFADRKRSHSKISILVIEDQSFLRRLVFEVLNINYTVNMAADLKAGLDLYVKEAPHIVFLDIGLPDGSGHVLASKLRQIDPTAYIVMVTGSHEREDVVTAKLNGVYGFILKPFSKGKILDAIQAYGKAFPNLINKGH